MVPGAQEQRGFWGEWNQELEKEHELGSPLPALISASLYMFRCSLSADCLFSWWEIGNCLSGLEFILPSVATTCKESLTIPEFQLRNKELGSCIHFDSSSHARDVEWEGQTWVRDIWVGREIPRDRWSLWRLQKDQGWLSRWTCAALLWNVDWAWVPVEKCRMDRH